MRSLWADDEPTPADFLTYLNDPLALQLAKGHARKTAHVFGLGERSVVSVTDLGHDEMTTVSIAKLFSVDQKWVRREAKAVTDAVRRAEKKHEKRAVRQADRAWRSRRK
jgi:hypothetical protein